MKKRLSPYRWRKRKLEVFERDGRKCKLCGSTYILDVHHIVRRSKGGTDDMDNLILLCRRDHEAQHPEKQLRWAITRELREQAAAEFNKLYSHEQ